MKSQQFPEGLRRAYRASELGDVVYFSVSCRHQSIIDTFKRGNELSFGQNKNIETMQILIKSGFFKLIENVGGGVFNVSETSSTYILYGIMTMINNELK